MSRSICLLLLASAGGGLPAMRGADVVFRSDVSLVRVDAQVVDRDNRTITGLEANDFVLRESGEQRQIRNFASEEMPVDVLLLLDVSGSMGPHVARIASASDRALRVLRDEDRAAVMVFDRKTRLRLPFRSSKEDVRRELHAVMEDEMFNGGTDITGALLSAADYVRREARPQARHAIVILTDDETERERDEAAVNRALLRADAVLMALLAPYEPPGRAAPIPQAGGGGGPWGGNPWPGGGPMGGPGGGPLGGPLGGIILGRRGPYGGRRGGGGGPVIGSRTRSAGTAEIARRSGGDSMPVDNASAFEDTLARIRQRYALYFYLPEGAKPGEERTIELALASAALRKHPDAEVHYRQTYMAPTAQSEPATSSTSAPASSAPTARPSDQAQPAQPSQGGWRKLKPGEQP